MSDKGKISSSFSFSDSPRKIESPSFPFPFLCRMDEHVVFQFEDENGHKYLSIYSPEFQLCRSHILPIKTESELVFGNCCRGLYLFTDYLEDFVVCNLSNLESKALTLSNLLEPPPNLAIFHACGIGQDPDSGLFKVVFTYNQHFSRDDVDREVYLGVENRALLYCLDTDSFKRVKTKWNFMANPDDNVYVGHERYWTAMMIGISKKAQFGPPFMERHVVSFNFQTEEFNYFSLPPYPNKDYKFSIVEYGASLGAVGYSGYNQFDKFDIWVNQEKSWTRIHCFHIGSSVVKKKVLALKEERFVMLEIPCEDDNSRSEVHVYDIVGDRVMVILDTRGRRGSLRIFSYVESRCRLKDGERMIRYIFTYV